MTSQAWLHQKRVQALMSAQRDLVKYYFQIEDRIDYVRAYSLVDARTQIMYSEYAPFYGRLQWLNVYPHDQTSP